MTCRCHRNKLPQGISAQNSTTIFFFNDRILAGQIFCIIKISKFCFLFVVLLLLLKYFQIINPVLVNPAVNFHGRLRIA